MKPMHKKRVYSAIGSSEIKEIQFNLKKSMVFTDICLNVEREMRELQRPDEDNHILDYDSEKD